MRSLGADEVIDYTVDDFTGTAEPYDVILDLVAHRSVASYRRALAASGTYRCAGGSVSTLLRVLTFGSVLGRLSDEVPAALQHVGQGRALGKVVVTPS